MVERSLDSLIVVGSPFPEELRTFVNVVIAITGRSGAELVEVVCRRRAGGKAAPAGGKTSVFCRRRKTVEVRGVVRKAGRAYGHVDRRCCLQGRHCRLLV